MERTLDTTNMDQAEAAGVEFSGDPGQWVCIAKAWNKSEGWMKSTKVLEVPGAGCFFQVTTKEKGGVAEAVCWAPGVRLSGDKGILEADYGQEDVEDDEDAPMSDFHFDVTQVANMVTFHAVYRDSVMDQVSLMDSELKSSRDTLRTIFTPFLTGVQSLLEEEYGVETSREYLFRLIHDEIVEMEGRTVRGFKR